MKTKTADTVIYVACVVTLMILCALAKNHTDSAIFVTGLAVLIGLHAGRGGNQ